MQITPFRWKNKPPLGTRLHLQHPQAQGLVSYFAFNEGAGSLLNNATAQNAGTLSSDYTWGSSSLGTALTMGTSLVTANRTNLPKPVFAGDFTVACLVTPLRAPNSTGQDIPAVGAWNSGGVAGTNEWLLILSNSGSTGDQLPRFSIEIGSTITGAVDTVNWTVGVPLFLVGVRQGTSQKLYRADAGVYKGLVGSAVCGSGAINSVSGRKLKLGEIDAGAGLNTNERVHWAGCWSRAFSAVEVSDLFYNPYGVFLAPNVRRFSPLTLTKMPILLNQYRRRRTN